MKFTMGETLKCICIPGKLVISVGVITSRSQTGRSTVMDSWKGRTPCSFTFVHVSFRTGTGLCKKRSGSFSKLRASIRRNGAKLVRKLKRRKFTRQ